MPLPTSDISPRFFWTAEMTRAALSNLSFNCLVFCCSTLVISLLDPRMASFSVLLVDSMDDCIDLSHSVRAVFSMGLDESFSHLRRR